MTFGWELPMYRETAIFVLGFIFIAGFVSYFLRKKSFYFVSSWASIKSWLFVAPILFFVFSFPDPVPLVSITLFAIFGAKVFFQLMGMYHRSYFVFIVYAGILGLGVSAYFDRLDWFNLSPMIVLGTTCLIPLVRNNYKKMIQYISLTNLAFVFLGWSFMHLGLLLKLPNGIYQLLYVILLTEFCDNTTLAISRYFGSQKMFNEIDHRRTWGGFVVSVLITILVAAAMRQLLPVQSEVFWITSGLVASIGGLFGDLVMDVIRKDAGIRTLGAFVLGRGDFLQRMDRLIFVAPIYYYVMLALQQKGV